MIASRLATSWRRRGGRSGGPVRTMHDKACAFRRLAMLAARAAKANMPTRPDPDATIRQASAPRASSRPGALQQAFGKALLIAARPPLRRRLPASLATRYFPLTVAIHKAMHAIPCLIAHSAISISGARQACDNRASKVIAPSRACLIYAQTEGATRLHSFYAHFPQFRDVGFAIRGASDVVIFAQPENAELRGAS